MSCFILSNTFQNIIRDGIIKVMVSEIPYYLYAWIGSGLYAAVVLLSKIVANHSIKNPWLFNFIWTVVTMVITGIVAFYFGLGLPIAWSNIIWGGISSTVAGILFFLALYKLDISVLAPLYNARTVFSILLAGIFLGEKLSPTQAFWMAVIIIGGVFVTYDERLKLRAFLQPAIAIAIVGILTSAVTGIFTNRAIADNGYWPATFWPLVIVAVLTAGTYPWFRKDLPGLKMGQVGIVMVLAIIEVAGILAVNKAFTENVGITSAIVNLPLSMVVTVLLSRLAPKLLEKHPAKVYAVRLVAAAVMIGAATQLPH